MVKLRCVSCWRVIIVKKKWSKTIAVNQTVTRIVVIKHSWTVKRIF